MSAQQFQQRPPLPDLSDKPSIRRKPPRPKTRTLGLRLRRDSGPVLAKWSTRPETPLLSWKFDEGNGRNDEEKSSVGGNRRIGRRVRVSVSARKLAAGLWRMRMPEVENRGFGHQSVGGHFGANVCHHVDRVHSSSAKDLLVHSPKTVSNPKHGIPYKCEPRLQLPDPAMEGATKWNPDGWKESDEIKRIFGQPKPSERRASTARAISALEVELEQARARINQLEADRRSSKKKLEQFLQKLSEERAAWRSREHEKIRAIMDDLKGELSREKKSRQRLEISNSKLVDELADAKSAAKRYLQEYQKERKTRELVEEVCDELAKEIGQDEAEVEALKRESLKLQEEVEDERRMLQMAEVWREERVQMKLVDAKVMLEEKYAQMNHIIEELESVMMSGSTTWDMEAIKKADSLLEVAASVDMQDVRELKYEPPNSDDIFSALEDVNMGESNERDVEPHDGYSLASRSSRIHTVTPDVAMVNQDHTHGQTNDIETSELEEEVSEWETVSHPEDQGSSYSPDGSDPPFSKHYQVSNMSRARETQAADIGEVNSKIRQLIKFPFPSKAGKNGRLSNGAVMSPEHVSCKGDLSPQDVTGQWSPTDPGNAQITRAMKGCIEWPRSAHRNSLKARLLEARFESQKIQLRQVLKQKI